MSVRATAASTIVVARRTVEYAAFLVAAGLEPSGITTRPIKFGRQKSRRLDAPAPKTSKERRRSTYAIILPNRSSCNGVCRKWFWGHFSKRGSTAAGRLHQTLHRPRTRDHHITPLRARSDAPRRARDTPRPRPFTKRAVEDRFHLSEKGPSGDSWTKCGLACRDRTIWASTYCLDNRAAEASASDSSQSSHGVAKGYFRSRTSRRCSRKWRPTRRVSNHHGVGRALYRGD